MSNICVMLLSLFLFSFFKPSDKRTKFSYQDTRSPHSLLFLLRLRLARHTRKWVELKSITLPLGDWEGTKLWVKIRWRKLSPSKFVQISEQFENMDKFFVFHLNINEMPILIRQFIFQNFRNMDATDGVFLEAVWVIFFEIPHCIWNDNFLLLRGDLMAAQPSSNLLFTAFWHCHSEP